MTAPTQVNFTALNAVDLPNGSAPDAIELLPAGEIIGHDGRRWINDKPDDIVAAFNLRIPIDISHSTELKAPNGDPAPAMGWCHGLENRGGAVWGVGVEWLATGRKLVEGKEYGYISPVFDYAAATRRIVSISSVALINTPNLNLTALNRRQEKRMSLPTTIAAALNIDSASTEEQAVGAINALKTDKQTALNAARTPNLDNFVPRNDHEAVVKRALNAEAKVKAIESEAQKTEIDSAIGAACEAGKIAPASTEFYKASCMQEGGLERFKEFIKTAPEIAPPSDLGGKKPPGSDGVELTPTDRAMCVQMDISQEDFLKEKAMG